MDAGEVAKLIEILGGVALIYVGLINLLFPILRALATPLRGASRGDLRHVARSGLVNLLLGAAALIVGATLLSVAFKGGSLGQNLGNGVHGVGVVIVLFLPVIVLAILTAVAYRLFRIEYAMRNWALGLAIVGSVVEVYMIAEYIIQRNPIVLLIAFIFLVPLVFRWLIVAARRRYA